MSLIKNLREMENYVKIIFVVFILIFSYVILICVIFPAIFSPSSLFKEEYILSFDTPIKKHLNFLSILISLGISFVFILLIKPKGVKKVNKIDLIKDHLSQSEKDLIKILEETKEITQDSLMFRLEWSRAKISTILTNLEKRNIVQRKREGKTYIVFLNKN